MHDLDQPTTTYRLALIEDNLQLRMLLQRYFGSSKYFNVVRSADSYEAFVASWGEQQIDLVLCDIELPGKSGIEATWHIKKRAPQTDVVIFTVLEQRDAVFQALCAGASGYLVKGRPMDEIEDRLLDVMRGGSVMSPQVARLVFSHFSPPTSEDAHQPTVQLTPREIEIVNVLRQGLSYKQIAESLFVSVDTVKYHTRNIYQKLHVSSRTELILKYK
ncbi:response regulator transcription factor [Sphingobacterium oryzagri]|uniref:Response regulator transcription factor n=1 Tax=Sphingobacterium oryzagri TaxID=3025669 RepID=A0ABY7WFN1_9SPHI|nr:response regulator transcription factor [Sphingobacterium sp. KACC 22765]WDF68327.1 response regulator transcription factor [Sphingobacterium sp. KACC 22765]